MALVMVIFPTKVTSLFDCQNFSWTWWKRFGTSSPKIVTGKFVLLQMLMHVIAVYLKGKPSSITSFLRTVHKQSLDNIVKCQSNSVTGHGLVDVWREGMMYVLSFIMRHISLFSLKRAMNHLHLHPSNMITIPWVLLSPILVCLPNFQREHYCRPSPECLQSWLAYIPCS